MATVKDAAGNSPIAVDRPTVAGEGARDVYGDLRVSTRTPLVELKSTYGLSNLRDVTTTANGGTVTNTVGSGIYTLSTNTSNNGSAILESAERGRYMPGSQGEVGIGVRRPTAPVSTQVIRWGLYDDNDGFYYGEDANGLFVGIRRGGIDNIIHNSAFNGSIGDIDLTEGHVFQIVFSWYGYGSIDFVLNEVRPNGLHFPRVLHRYRNFGTTSVEDPNLPIRAEVDNGASGSTNFTCEVAGRQYSVQSEYRPNRRINSERRLSLGSIGTTPLPTVTLRRKSAYQSVSVKLAGIDLITDTDTIIEVYLNASLTGASYGGLTNTTPTETALESDTSASAVSGGELVYAKLVNASGSGVNSDGTAALVLDQDFIGLQPLTVAVRRVTGTGSTMSVLVRAAEEW